MGDEQAHQVAVANSVDGLHNDLVEGEAGWQLLGWDCGHPVHPLTSLLVKEVVMHATILQADVQRLNVRTVSMVV